MINQSIYVLLSICINTSIAKSYEDTQLLFDDLTDPEAYQKWIRPPVLSSDQSSDDMNGPLYVNISIDLYNYATVDEITSEYTFHLFIDMEWFDSRLQFLNLRKNIDADELVIEGGQYHISRIWYPSVFIPNNQDPGSFDYDNQSANLVKIKRNGYVWLRKRKLLGVYCNMDFRLYPFDVQMCYLHLESSISTTNTLRLRWNTKMPFSTADSFRTIGFTLRDYETIVTEKTYSKNNTFSRVSLSFTLVREWEHHIFLFYLPTTIIVIASWASFWLEITSPPARVSIGVTTMLALVTTFKNTKSQLPSVSYWNAVDIWNMVCILFIFSSLMEFACVNYIFNTEKRRIKNKKMKRKRQKSVLMAKEVVPKVQSRQQSIDTLDSFYTTTISTLGDLNRKLSDFDVHRKKTSICSEPDFTKRAMDRKNSTFDSSKSRLLSVGIDLMPHIKEDPLDCQQRRASVRSRSRSMINTSNGVNDVSLKATPQEVANCIDQKARYIFPIGFMIFNLCYWTFVLYRA